MEEGGRDVEIGAMRGRLMLGGRSIMGWVLQGNW